MIRFGNRVLTCLRATVTVVSSAATQVANHNIENRCKLMPAEIVIPCTTSYTGQRSGVNERLMSKCKKLLSKSFVARFAATFSPTICY